jgi:hypothetical protein
LCGTGGISPINLVTFAATQNGVYHRQSVFNCQNSLTEMSNKNFCKKLKLTSTAFFVINEERSRRNFPKQKKNRINNYGVCNIQIQMTNKSQMDDKLIKIIKNLELTINFG